MEQQSQLSTVVAVTPALVSLESDISNEASVTLNYIPRPFLEQAAEVGNKPVGILEIDVEMCSNVYGDAATTGLCRAVLNAQNFDGIFFADKCYNGFKTCQDKANFAAQVQTLRFIEGLGDIPTNFHGDPSGIPSVIPDSANPTPATITQGRGIGAAATFGIKLRDHPHDDVGLDPYVDERAYDPLDQGTYWGKMLARAHLEHRPMRWRVGYLDTEDDLSTFRTHNYQIEKIAGPDAKGEVVITGRDHLKLAGAGFARNEPSLCPLPIDVTLASDIIAASTSFTVSDGAELISNNTVRINDELIDIGTVTGDTVIIVSRGVGGSEQDDHSIDDNVQNCQVYSNTNVVDIVTHLIANFTPLNASEIPADRWLEQKTTWLTFYNLTRYISEPTAVETLIAELSITCLFDLWRDEENNTIELRAISPGASGQLYPRINELEHIIDGSLRIEQKIDEQVTRLLFSYGQENQTDSSDENLKRVFVRADLDAEGVNARGIPNTRVEQSRWIGKSQLSQVVQTSGRLFAAFNKPPVEGRFRVQAKDSYLKIGDLFDLDVEESQTESGAMKPIRCQVISRDEIKIGQEYEIRFKSAFFRFGTRFAFIAPDATPDYSAASDTEKQNYAFIAPDTGQFSDGTDAYAII